jgi:hypothetical protein
MGLIEKFPGRFMAEMKDGINLDLAKYVQLSSSGRRVVAQLEELEMANADKPL